MKKISLILVLIGALIVPCTSKAQGGPDAFGYTWNTSLNAGGPTYNWIDITTRSGVQTVTGLADDNSAAGMINIGFSFHFYWTDQSQLKVGSNGWLAFGNVGNIASCFPTVPTAGGAADNYLAPLMGDLNFSGGGNPGQVKYWTNSVDSFIISYINVPFWQVNSPGYLGSNNFQVILCKSDSSITYQYGALSGFSANAACVDLTVGIENSTGTIGLQPHSDAMPPSSYAIRFDYPAVELISIQDVMPEWNFASDNAGQLIAMNAPLTPQSNIKSAGNTNVTSTISLQTNIRNSANVVVHNASGTIPTLNSGDDSLFSFTPWTPNATGSYSFETTTSNSNDVNAGNDFNSIELQVVDLCASSTLLSYVANAVPSGSLNWNGGTTPSSFGASVYFEPPVYPYTVSSLEYYITSNVSDNFVAAVYDDDGPNGTAGTLLFTTTVAAGSVIANGWNTVTVSPGVVLNSGGFYVTWYQGGTTIFLGTQNTGPFSRRTYEILSGSWATYRNSHDLDLFIRATISNYTTVPQAGFTSAYTGPSYDYQFSDTTVGLVASWAWDFGDGSTSTLQNPSHTFASSGTYTVCLVTTSPCGGTNSVCQTVNACIPASISVDPLSTVVCDGATTSFIVSASGDGLTYQWQVDQGSGFTNISGFPYSGETTATLTVNAGTALNTYSYRSVVTGSCGTATSGGAILTVNALPTVTLNSFASVCETESAFALTGESPAGGTFSGTGVSGGNFDPTVAGVGSHTVNYIYTDANSCTDAATATITVDAKPVAVMTAFSDVCTNSSAFALSNGTPAGGTYSGTGVSAGSFDPAVAGAGTHTIDYIVANGACSDTAQGTLTVNAEPVVTLSSFTTVCSDDALFTLTGGSPAGGTYSGTGVTAGDFDPASSGTGTFVITYAYTDTNNCSASAQENLVVDACLGVDNSIAVVNSVFPNPSKGMVTVVSGTANALLFVYDMSGKLVHQMQMNNISTQLNLHHLSAGVYTFRIQSAKEVSTYKLVLEK